MSEKLENLINEELLELYRKNKREITKNQEEIKEIEEEINSKKKGERIK